MQKPRKPKYSAPSHEWDRYWRELEQWKESRKQERQSQRPYDPSRASGEVKAVYNPNTSTTDNYFGGEGEPDGPYHGHYALNEDGNENHLRGGRDPGERY